MFKIGDRFLNTKNGSYVYIIDYKGGMIMTFFDDDEPFRVGEEYLVKGSRTGNEKWIKSGIFRRYVDDKLLVPYNRKIVPIEWIKPLTILNDCQLI